VPSAISFQQALVPHIFEQTPSDHLADLGLVVGDEILGHTSHNLGDPLLPLEIPIGHLHLAHGSSPQPSTFFLRECGMIVNLFLRRKVDGEDPADTRMLHHTRKEGIAHGSSRSSKDAVDP
jgi:hypothetical protein